MNGVPTLRTAAQLIEEGRGRLATPYYLIDEARLARNMERIRRVRDLSGTKSVLALKCFSTWAVFGLMKESMDGTTSSSLFEARLGHETFGKETHAYSVAYSDDEVEALRGFASKIVFNSVSQLRRFQARVAHLPVGLRINPGVSHSHFDLADPARPHCRLGVSDKSEVREVLPLLSGAMFHCNCENDDLASFGRILDRIATDWGDLIKDLEWVSLGGGIYFTQDGYPIEEFARLLSDFARRFSVQVYLEPGESAITRSGFLIASVLDIVRRDGVDIAVVDAAVETHMLDLLIYHTDAKMEPSAEGARSYQLAGRTCLAGDIFGTYKFSEQLEVGSRVAFADAAGYTMVKKNWFNGVAMPAIAVRRLNGRTDLVRSFGYEDFKASLS